VTVGVPALLLALASTAAPSLRGKSVPPIAVSVNDPLGVSRADWPVSVSVAFPAGALRDPSVIRLTDSAGASLPVQVRTLARWPNGSLRWVLVDTRMNLEAGKKAGFEVRVGDAGSKSHRGRVKFDGGALRVVERHDAFEVNTGPLRFQVPKNRFAILDKVEAGGVSLRDGMTSFVVEEDEKLQARPPREVRLTENGPLRANFEIRGDYGNGIDYLVRLEAFAGKPFVRVRHTFTNRRPAAHVDLARIAVEWPLVLGPGAEYVFGVEGAEARRGQVPDGGLRFYQLDNLRYQVAGAEEAGKAEGWWEIHAKALSIGIGVRWFWQEYPQAVELRSDRLVYDMWPSEASPVKVGVGAAKTHEFVVWVTPMAEVAGGSGLALLRSPVATVDPAWIVKTRALSGAVAPAATEGEFVRRALEGFEEYMRRNAAERWDDRGEIQCGSDEPARPRVGAYGMWNWGDWNFPGYHDATKGCDAWGNLEYDTTQVLALLFAATGRPEVYEAMLAAARHFIDVDTIHFSDEHPEWVGMNHPKNPLHFSFGLGGVDLGHTWTEGLVSAYYLTGDERFLTAARGIADYLVRRVGSDPLVGNPRQWGWPQIALLAVYDATHAEAYRKAAIEYARRGMRVYTADRVNQWKLGILADALAYTHAAAGDRQIGSWLRSYARGVAQAHKRDPRFYPAVAYVAALDGEAGLRDVALDRARQLQPRGWGKPFTLDGRIGFRIYSLLGGMR
jgi:hypothetical protein